MRRGGEAKGRLSLESSRAAKILVTLSAPLVLSCAGSGMLVPVFLPGEPLDCLFEVVGEVTVAGPFDASDDSDGAPRDGILRSVRLGVGQEAADSGADAVLVRELQYDRDRPAGEDDVPVITAVEGILISFVDPTCTPGG